MVDLNHAIIYFINLIQSCLSFFYNERVCKEVNFCFSCRVFQIVLADNNDRYRLKAKIAD